MAFPPLSASEIPILETPRLRLRPHTALDLPAACRLWSDPNVIRYTIVKPSTPEEVWSRILRYLGLWSLLGFGYWVIEEKSTGAFVGELGLCDFHRDIHPPLGDTPEIGWTLLPAFHGKGYATEAAQACIAWAKGPPVKATRLACIIHTDNVGSLRLAAKCGFTPTHLTTYKGSPTFILHADLRSTKPQL